MKIIKKIDIFILKSYLLLFAGTFFICLFIFMMQFMWRYVDELIGKGLSGEILAKFFYYSGLTLVPMSLPLAILLASLITFGNLGEKFELLSMKASGIPLVRILQPVFFFVIVVCLGSFYFQNVIGPEATKQLASLIWSMKQKSPELEIPEGIFYNEIPGYNLFVEHKDKKTGMLYGVMIYSTTGGYNDAQIVLADSARLQSTADKMHLRLTLFNGERFRNMESQNGQNVLRANIPYMRESFISEVDLIPFDGNFNLMDANLFSGNAQTKDLREILHGIDSLRHDLDSVGHYVAGNTMQNYLRKSLPVGQKDSMSIIRQAKDSRTPLDSIYNNIPEEQKVSAWKTALTRARTVNSEYDYRSYSTSNMNESLRKHYIEAHKKFTMALACLLFFFIGAPLGAIIRKGGLGVSVVISVIIFIFYYMVNVGSEKMAKTGEWNILSGVWLSSAILLPIGLFLINRANKDSVVFNVEGYRNFFQRLLGLRTSRRLNRKEVIINDPDYPALVGKLQRLTDDCKLYATRGKLYSIPNYWTLFFRYREDRVAIDLNERLEAIVEELHNTRDNVILARLNDLPILVPDAHTRPFHNASRNMAVGIFLPLGLFFWLRIWRYRLRLWHDMQQIHKLGTQIRERILKNHIQRENE
ncbi:MAG: LptF/LptG family permease [Bacteroidaceae bacterium]|nr:LptF/LptG family permease [Bacteroidaceae bacterium]